MGRVAEKILAALAAEVGSRTEWDEPPALYFLHLADGKCLARPIDIPRAIWASGPPALVLSAMADCMEPFADLLRQISPEGLRGAAFYSETWTVRQPEAGTALRSEVMADAMAHRLHTRPDRVEARTMWAVDRAGNVYGAIKRRDIDDAPKTTVAYAKAGRRIGGEVPDALGRMVTALLAVTMPGQG
jgi:hypothetical protein